MFWRGEEDPPERPEGAPSEGPRGPIRIEPDAPRPAAILKVAGELEERGGEILELFKEIASPLGRAVLPIHLLKDEETFFVEVATEPWDERRELEVAGRIAALRNSEDAEARVELLSAYPVPDELRFLCERSPAALLQLDLLRVRLDRPEEAAGTFREVASRHWGVDLDFEPDYLPLVEDLLMAALADEDHDGPTPVTEGLVSGVGSFLGEIIRRNAGFGAAWRPPENWGEGPVVEAKGFALDPVGKARAFLHEGPEESLSFYATYVLDLLDKEDYPEPRA
ncbi:MAG: hypothetical protein AVDCRST_MAG03-1508 [uncultured Rubrobacteraceae bacterium]|uniref:Uncharacterized protein n=1 Tax=uncultured Rubrobacteraceae bacterium TaxID=349277 RepID=A0A6J4PBP7_9ACTN|nr:MAG: hypothetical protein AVDCRST_MAG03-1508 [uncultured Rubrobacteraceae bacterium]